MENIVGVRFVDKVQGQGAIITSGRLFHPVSDRVLLQVIKKKLTLFGISQLENLELCYSLTEVSDFPYFYEQLAYFVKNPIPFGHNYEKWVRKKQISLKKGKDILFLGFKKL